MDWGHASLGGLLRHKEEVEALDASVVLDEVVVDDAAWWRVLSSATVSTHDEHPLIDPLVDDCESNWWWSTHLVVQRLESFLELTNLALNDLVSHLIANTVSVDDELGGHLTLVAILELLDGSDEASIKVLLHELLILWLNDDVRVILGMVRISGGAKADDTLLTCVAHVDANHHHLLTVHKSRPLHPQRLSTELGVDLLHDVRGHRHVHSPRSLLLDALSQDVEA